MKKHITKNGIKSYFHCKTCLTKNNEPDKIAVGWTWKGLQVWCDNCDTNVIALDFLGNKVSIDLEPKETKHKEKF
jgi:hypothetical protein